MPTSNLKDFTTPHEVNHFVNTHKLQFLEQLGNLLTIENGLHHQNLYRVCKMICRFLKNKLDSFDQYCYITNMLAMFVNETRSKSFVDLGKFFYAVMK